MPCLSICLQLTSYVLAFISYLVQGEKLTISAGGHIKVGRQTREVYWGKQNNGDEHGSEYNHPVLSVIRRDYVQQLR